MRTSYKASKRPPQRRTLVFAMPLTAKSKGLKKKPPEGLPTLRSAGRGNNEV